MKLKEMILLFILKKTSTKSKIVYNLRLRFEMNFKILKIRHGFEKLFFFIINLNIKDFISMTKIYFKINYSINTKSTAA